MNFSDENHWNFYLNDFYGIFFFSISALEWWRKVICWMNSESNLSFAFFGSFDSMILVVLIQSQYKFCDEYELLLKIVSVLSFICCIFSLLVFLPNDLKFISYRLSIILNYSINLPEFWHEFLRFNNQTQLFERQRLKRCIKFLEFPI